MVILNLKKDTSISKQDILTLAPQADIYAYYLQSGIGNKYFSPYREEKIPSISLVEMSSGDILWRDWGDAEMSKPADFVALVMKIHSCSYEEALNHINKDLKLKIEPKFQDIETFSHIAYKFPKASRELTNLKIANKKKIYITRQPFTSTDIKYWGEYGISISTLKKYKVHSVANLWLDMRLVKIYSKNNPIYAYEFNSEKVTNYKIYMPLSPDKTFKWMFDGDSNMISGLDMVPYKGDILVITKSLKDVMCLHEMEIPAIALQSETINMKDDFASDIYDRYNNIFVLYDYDQTGIKKAIEFADLYDFKPIYIETDSNDVKDISDFIKKYGIEAAKVYMRKLIYY
jgi:hypothetical protein